MGPKYTLTRETTDYLWHTLYRIKALMSFGDVRRGDLGGFVESRENLSQYGQCWVADDACVLGDAWVCDNSRVYGSAEVYGRALVYGNGKVTGGAKVCGRQRVRGNMIID